MSKSLTESAAEILKASLGSAGKEPMQSGPEAGTDLGGQTPTTEPEAIGAKAASMAKEAPKPGQAGAPAEPMKKGGGKTEVAADEEKDAEDAVSEEVVAEEAEELTEEELDAYLNSLTEEELNELIADLELDEAKEEDEDEEDEKDEDEDEEDTKMKKEEVESIEEMGSAQPMQDKAPKKMPKAGKPKMAEETETETAEVVEEQPEVQEESIKDIVAKNMGSCVEDIDALFNGESLSEEFRGKATVIFEAAVRSRVESIVEKIVKENDEKVSNEIAAIEESLTDQVDGYLNYVVEQWMEENKLAVETGLRTEIAEEFIEGLKGLFVEHYIDIPEEKAEIFDEMAEKLVASEEKIAEQNEKIAAMSKELNESKAEEILRKVCEGLTEVQTQKIKALAEGVEFTTEGDYKQKLEVLRENYFPSGNKVKPEAPVSIVETDEPKATNSVMDYYVNAITKTLPK